MRVQITAEGLTRKSMGTPGFYIEVDDMAHAERIAAEMNANPQTAPGGPWLVRSAELAAHRPPAGGVVDLDYTSSAEEWERACFNPHLHVEESS